jgi:hypothetical protein
MSLSNTLTISRITGSGEQSQGRAPLEIQTVVMPEARTVVGTDAYASAQCADNLRFIAPRYVRPNKR